MNCLTYARVSTDKQAEKELSIPAQLQAMRQHATDRGWTILEEYVEAGASARTTERPTLRELLARCRNQEETKVDVVLVHKIDRLARNLADHVAIRAQLRGCGVTIASSTEALEDSVSGQLVEHILAAMAEFYSANLSEEVKKGMRQKVLQGGWPGPPPRGYRTVLSENQSRVVLDDVQAPLVRKAFDLCLLRYRGLVDLRLRLAAEGLQSKTGKPLSNAQLGRLLTNPFYCGMMRWKGQVYPAKHPSLVSAGVFEQVQRILKSRSRPLLRRPTKLLLTGLAHCAECGLLVGGDEHRRWRYYRCRGSFRSFQRCKARYARVDRVHGRLEVLLQSTHLTASLKAQLLRLLSADATEQINAQDREQASIRRRLLDLRHREDHLTKAFAERLLTFEGHRRAIESLAFERKEVEKLVKPGVFQSLDRVDALSAAIARARTAWDIYVLLTLRQQRVLVQTVFERLEIDRSGIVRHKLMEHTSSAAA